MIIHNDVGAAVDALLRGRTLIPELRYLDENEQVHIGKATDYGVATQPTTETRSSAPRKHRGREWENGKGHSSLVDQKYGDSAPAWNEQEEFQPETFAPPAPPAVDGGHRKLMRIFPYGIGQNRLRVAANTLNVPIEIVDNLNQADVVMTLKNYYRQQPQPIADAERRNIPVYILRSNTATQMEQCLVDIFHMPSDPIDVFTEAMRETQEGIQRVMNGTGDAELQPQSAAIRSQQHQLVRAANLVSHSYGREPYRRVRIFRK